MTRRYLFGKYVLDIPSDHKISDIHHQDALYDRGYGFILEEIAAAKPESTMIDIGANVGDTAAFFATYVHNPILAVEASPQFLPFLRSNVQVLGPQVTTLEAFVRPSALAGSDLRYQSVGGTGTLDIAPAGEGGVDEEAFVSVPQLLARACERAPEVSLIKSDTDGCDSLLVSEFMEHAPDSVLFFECDTVHGLSGVRQEWPEIFDRLSEDNYGIVVFDNFGLPMLATDSRPGELLRDLSAYIRLQHGMQKVNIYYLDVWAFPLNTWANSFDRVATFLRGRLLKDVDGT